MRQIVSLFLLLLALPAFAISTVSVGAGSSVSYGTPGNYHWIPYRGFIPPDAVMGGEEPSRPLYICQANYRGGKHPGKLVDGRCNITYAGREIPMYSFRLLVGEGMRFVRANARRIPGNAVVGGTENGRLLFICRAKYNGGVHPGKLVAGNCNIGYDGNEIVTHNFRVLAVTGERGPYSDDMDDNAPIGSSVNYGVPEQSGSSVGYGNPQN